MAEDTVTKTKEMLDDMHKRKIDMADAIFVINVLVPLDGIEAFDGLKECCINVSGFVIIPG